MSDDLPPGIRVVPLSYRLYRGVIVSAFVLVSSQGITSDFAARWLRSCALTWPVAFPTVTLLAPWVRRMVGRLTVA